LRPGGERQRLQGHADSGGRCGRKCAREAGGQEIDLVGPAFEGVADGRVLSDASIDEHSTFAAYRREDAGYGGAGHDRADRVAA
jgi:hypothetical protein